MKNSLIVRLTDKDLKVLEALFEYRGMELFQLLMATGYGIKGRHGIYKNIRSLRDDKGMISQVTLNDVIKKEGLRGRNDGKMYFLTAKGYEYMLGYFRIPLGHVGKGFNRDHGEFEYALAKPPTRFVSHHLAVVDALLVAREFQKSVDGINPHEHSFDYRDNRYASRRYDTLIESDGTKADTRKMNLRPAAELLINSESYFVEVDMDTRSAEKVDSKFENYKSYFDYLTDNGEPLPVGIIFVSQKSEFFIAKQRRSQTIANSFSRVLEKYACEVKLMYESVDMLHEVFTKEYYADK